MEHSQKNVFTDGVRNTSFPVQGRNDCPAFLTTHQHQPKQGIVVIQEWWGLNTSITLTAQYFAKEGLMAVVPDIYRSKTATNHQQAKHKMDGLDFGGAVKDIIAAGQFLKSKGCQKLFITGFCMGGALTLATTFNSGLFAKAFPFYGIPSGYTHQNIAKVTTPIVAFFGALDHAVGFSDAQSAKKLKEAFQKEGKKFELVLFEKAGHAFMNRDRQTFDASAYQTSMKKILEEMKK